MANELYHTILLLAAGINFLIAFVLLYNNIWFRYYEVYRRARQLVALCYIIFAIGFALHAFFEWRTSWPAAASALSVSYFHIGGVLFGWSHTSLMRPDYLTRKVVLRDLIILLVGLASYWTAVVNCELCMMNYAFLIFFFHASFIAFIFYRTYFQVRRNLMRMPADEKAPKWWTPEAKRTVLNGHHSFVISCHLIVLFGIGSMVVTAVFPHQITPYTVLLCMGIAVYCYIFYSLTEYGNAIEAATCATEDAKELRIKILMMKSNKISTIRLMLAMLLLLIGSNSVYAWDSEPDANGKYDQYFDRPTHFPHWEQPAEWPNVQMFLCEVRLNSAIAPRLTNYEIAVYDQNGELRHCNRSIAKDDDCCVLTVRGEESDEFHFKIIYGDDFLHPTIVDVPDLTYRFKTNEIVGSANEPFMLIATGRFILSEDAAMTPVSKTGVDVSVLRTINAGEWSTICLPFAIDADKMDAVFGDGWQLANFTGCDVTYTDESEETVQSINVKFEAATAIEANHPYIIKVSNNILQIDIDDVDLNFTGDEEPSVDCDEYAYQAQVGRNKYETRYWYNSFVGNYTPNFLIPDQCLFLNGGKFWYSKGKSKLRSFRAYFDFYDLLPESESSEAGSRITFSISDSEQTTIVDVRHVPAFLGGIYTLNGLQVQHPVKGLYIRDGKKIIVK